MNLDRAVLAFAGLMILVSLALICLVSSWFWLFTAFIGLNLLQAAFTGFCSGRSASWWGSASWRWRRSPLASSM